MNHNLNKNKRPITNDEFDTYFSTSDNNLGLLDHIFIDDECYSSFLYGNNSNIHIFHEIKMVNTNEHVCYEVCDICIETERCDIKSNEYGHLFDVFSCSHNKFLEFRNNSINMAKVLQVLTA